MEVQEALVKHLLRNPYLFKWTVQGFGMMRMYLDDKWRLQVWDGSLVVLNSTNVHDHPWTFTSHIISGRITNKIYREDSDGTLYHQVLIIPGEQGGVIEKTEDVRLRCIHAENYGAGTSYTMAAPMLHVTQFAIGTVTLIERERTGADVARSLWNAAFGDTWVSAAPRPALPSEIESVTKRALRLWLS